MHPKGKPPAALKILAAAQLAICIRDQLLENAELNLSFCIFLMRTLNHKKVSKKTAHFFKNNGLFFCFLNLFFLFLMGLKALQGIIKVLIFCGILWFALPLAVWIATETITGKYLDQVPIMNAVCDVLFYACFVLAPLTLLQNIIRMIRKDRNFSFIKLIFSKKEKMGIEAKLGGATIAASKADKVTGVVFGKEGGKYATMPETTDGHILIIGRPGDGKTAAIAIPTLIPLDRVWGYWFYLPMLII